MSCFLLDMLAFYNSFSFYVDFVQNNVILDHIRGPVNKKCEIPIILGCNFGRNGLTWPYNIKIDMNREKIELSEYPNRFGAYGGAFWDIICRKLLIFFRFLPIFRHFGSKCSTRCNPIFLKWLLKLKDDTIYVNTQL